MAITEIFRSAELRKRTSGARKENSSEIQIFEMSGKRKKKIRKERSGKLK